MKRYTESYVNEMIEHYRNKLYNVKTTEEYDFYMNVLKEWKRILNKIVEGK